MLNLEINKKENKSKNNQIQKENNIKLNKEKENLNKKYFKTSNLFKNIINNKLNFSKIIFREEIKLKNYALFAKGSKYNLNKFTTSNFFYDPIIFKNKNLNFYLVKLVKNNHDYILFVLYKDNYYKNLINSLTILFHTKLKHNFNDIYYEFMKINYYNEYEDLIYKIYNHNYIKTSLIIDKENLRKNLFIKNNKFILKYCNFEMILLKN